MMADLSASLGKMLTLLVYYRYTVIWDLYRTVDTVGSISLLALGSFISKRKPLHSIPFLNFPDTTSILSKFSSTTCLKVGGSGILLSISTQVKHTSPAIDAGHGVIASERRHELAGLGEEIAPCVMLLR